METPSIKTRLKKYIPTSIGSGVCSSEKSTLGKRNRVNNPWEEFLQSIEKSKKKDFSIRYYFTTGPEGIPITQDDRNFIAQAMEYYSTKSKRDRLVDVPPLQHDIQGVTNNRDTNNPVREIFKTVKHLQNMHVFIQNSRAEHNYFVLNISVDGSRYFGIL